MSDELRKRAREVWAVEGAIRYREQALEIVRLSSEDRVEHEHQLAGYLKRLAALLPPEDAEPVGVLHPDGEECLREGKVVDVYPMALAGPSDVLVYTSPQREPELPE